MNIRQAISTSLHIVATNLKKAWHMNKKMIYGSKQVFHTIHKMFCHQPKIIYIHRKILDCCLDILYPRYCYVCQCSLEQSDNLYLCWSCWRKIPLIRGSICEHCGMPLSTPHTKNCLFCRSQQFSFRETRCAGRYQDTLRDLLLSFKFRGAVQLQYLLAGMMAWQIRTKPFHQKPQVIIPVPMKPKDEYRRGYNQAELIAVILAKQLHIPCYRHGLEKIKTNARQAELTRDERKKNVANNFRVSQYYQNQVANKTVLLVDDIFTTGSTAHECAKALRKATAICVNVATVARTIPQ